MDLPVEIKLPQLWGDQAFQKRDWGGLNYLVGPNGTGKTMFAEQLRSVCARFLKVRYLSADRLSGLERATFAPNEYAFQRGFNLDPSDQFKHQAPQLGLGGDALLLLREKMDVRIRVSAALSQLFGRNINLAEVGGFLKPTLQMKVGSSYALKEGESHGIKEFIILLTFLYDPEFNCLVLDEPETHLHPQMQMPFVELCRQQAGDPRTDPSKKCFFFITHSPFVADLRTLDDLRHYIVFRQGKLPTFWDGGDAEDKIRIERLLPILNTHHKQFLFAERPIFVEGYRDQQLYSIIQERRGKSIGAAGGCFIDGGGKDTMDLFFRLAKALAIEAQFIVDLDAALRGKLRQSVAGDERCKTFLRGSALDDDLMKVVSEMISRVDDYVSKMGPSLVTEGSDCALANLGSALDHGASGSNSDEATNHRRRTFLSALDVLRSELAALVPQKVGDLQFISARWEKVRDAFRSCSVHVLRRGQLEQYLPAYSGNPFAASVSDNLKQGAFATEREFLFSASAPEIEWRQRYGELVDILDEAAAAPSVNLDHYLGYEISNWIHGVQQAVAKDHIGSAAELKANALVHWELYSQILDVISFEVDGSTFVCKARLLPRIDQAQREIEFTDHTVPAKFALVRTC